jgi:hypothetical protein
MVFKPSEFHLFTNGIDRTERLAINFMLAITGLAQ